MDERAMIDLSALPLIITVPACFTGGLLIGYGSFCALRETANLIAHAGHPLHAFAAENEARLQAMSAAGSQITRELEVFRVTLRRVRQKAITAGIIELSTAAASANMAKSSD